LPRLCSDCPTSLEGQAGQRKRCIPCVKRKDAEYKTIHSVKYRKSVAGKIALSNYNKSPEGRYSAHKTRAKERGIKFNLTFDEWWSLWKPYYGSSGKGRLVMCRLGDTGPYEIGNVRIDTASNNALEMWSIRKTSGKVILDDYNPEDIKD